MANAPKEKEKKLSPMMSHYKDVKELYPDCVVFYRLGDFYEMFFEDAIRVSKLLDLTLTGRDCGLEERAPMCGIPFHAADGYIAKLVSFGEKVAICEQVEDPTTAKGLVKRSVVRIISAGTITEDGVLDEKKNNYIASVSVIDDEVSVAYADITTGEFYVKNLPDANEITICDELTKTAPSEIICNQQAHAICGNSPVVIHEVLPKFSLFREYAFSVKEASNTLKTHFEILNFTCFGIEDNDTAISACGALISYLSETQKHALCNVNKIDYEEISDFMLIDATAHRNLELTKTLRDGKRYGSLLWLLDNCQTAMGSRNLTSWINKPLLDINKINYRLDGVEELYKDPLMRNATREILSNIRDTERLSGKISNGNITPRDCEYLAKSLSVLPKLKDVLKFAFADILTDVNKHIYDFSELTSLLSHAITENAPINFKDGGYIAEGFDKELDRLRNISKSSEKIIREMEEREREATGIKTLRINYNRVFGYYIEVTNSFKDKVPYSYARKQTLVGAERFITEELKNLEDEILGAKDKALKLEADIFSKIKSILLSNVKNLQNTSRAIACLDCLTSFAYIAKSKGYCKPLIKNYGEELKIVDGRHPVVEHVSNENFIPNNALLNSSTDRMMIITGPNMAGKSTYMRQIALITIMAHIGAFVPCKSAEIPLTDKIFTRVGASDNLIFDQSTFMVEMSEVASILNKATANSLLILDEVGRGTSTFDGLSIAWAVVEFICQKIKAKTLFATHYNELSELEGKLDGVKNYKVTVKELGGKIIFLRKIAVGSANKSFGIEVASLAGVPKAVTNNAKKILKRLEMNDLAGGNDLETNEEDETIIEVNENLTEIISAIETADVDSMTPRQALDFIYELKNKILR